jgi:anti-sigma regulatory factor (Ser/Thr protein kinase)
MEDLSLHILDIVQNSIEADATIIEIHITEMDAENLLIITITDNGKGMDSSLVEKAKDPLGTSKNKKWGLGIPLFMQSAEESGGHVTLQSEPGKGTSLTASFELNNIDRKPMGDIATTLITLIATHPEIDYYYHHIRNEQEFSFDTREIKTVLSEVPINAPEVIRYLREQITAWFKNSPEHQP